MEEGWSGSMREAIQLTGTSVEELFIQAKELLERGESIQVNDRVPGCSPTLSPLVVSELLYKLRDHYHGIHPDKYRISELEKEISRLREENIKLKERLLALLTRDSNEEKEK